MVANVIQRAQAFAPQAAVAVAFAPQTAVALAHQAAVRYDQLFNLCGKVGLYATLLKLGNGVLSWSSDSYCTPPELSEMRNKLLNCPGTSPLWNELPTCKPEDEELYLAPPETIFCALIRKTESAVETIFWAVKQPVEFAAKKFFFEIEKAKLYFGGLKWWLERSPLGQIVLPRFGM